MKNSREIMEILEAYDLTGSYRAAAELAGCDHHTVARYVKMRAAGQAPEQLRHRERAIDAYLGIERTGTVTVVVVVRSLTLFAFAALSEIGGAWLIWQGVREHRSGWWIGAGIIALGLYGFVATFQPEANFGRILAAYGGVFVAGSLAWGMVMDGFRPDRWDVIGALVCLAGVLVIMYAPRA